MTNDKISDEEWKAKMSENKLTVFFISDWRIFAQVFETLYHAQKAKDHEQPMNATNARYVKNTTAMETVKHDET